MEHRFWWPKLVAAAIVAALLIAPLRATAQEAEVPVALQVGLLVKVVAYDRNLASRARGEVLTIVLVKEGNSDSARAAAQAVASLGAVQEVAGIRHAVETIPFASAGALAETCRAKRASVLYVGPGFAEREIAEIGAALAGVDVLSAGALPSFVPKGIVLGFDLVSGKPKLVLDLNQARKQNVALPADVLRLMQVYR